MMSRATASLDAWLRQHGGLVRAVVIPRELKWEVRDKLDQGNINERVLFPGLDGLSSWLRRQFTQRPLTPRQDQKLNGPLPRRQRR